MVSTSEALASDAAAIASEPGRPTDSVAQDFLSAHSLQDILGYGLRALWIGCTRACARLCCRGAGSCPRRTALMRSSAMSASRSANCWRHNMVSRHRSRSHTRDQSMPWATLSHQIQYACRQPTFAERGAFRARRAVGDQPLAAVPRHHPAQPRSVHWPNSSIGGCTGHFGSGC